MCPRANLEALEKTIILLLMELVLHTEGGLCIVAQLCMSVVQTDVYVRGTGYFKMNDLDFSVVNIMMILFSIM